MRGKTIASVLILAAALAQPTLATAQVESPGNDMNMSRDEGDNWGWLGLLGLVGLVGLRRRDRTEVRVAPRTA